MCVMMKALVGLIKLRWPNIKMDERKGNAMVTTGM